MQLSQLVWTYYDPGEESDRAEDPLHELEEAYKQVCIESIEAEGSRTSKSAENYRIHRLLSSPYNLLIVGPYNRRYDTQDSMRQRFHALSRRWKVNSGLIDPFELVSDDEES